MFATIIKNVKKDSFVYLRDDESSPLWIRGNFDPAFCNFMRKLLFCLLFIGLVCLCSCENSKLQDFHASLSGQIYVSDTMLYKDHSYILVRNSMTPDFQVLHSPDCFCRYNRKFIVVKHSN